jgi:SAM-dependent methyltransferase
MSDATSPRPIAFEDGAAYERGMGGWSRLAGEAFLDWLAPPPGLAWIDVGCGGGAFTALLAERCRPAALLGIDPSAAQLAFAHSRPELRSARFEQADALTLPAEDAGFDAAVMALVLFFVPDPARGIAELRRVLRPGGLACAYLWDILEGGFPYEPILAGLRAIGRTPQLPPSAEISRRAAFAAAWRQGGFREVELREITVRRRFASFDDYWVWSTGTGSLKPTIERLPAEQVAEVKAVTAGLLEAVPGGGVAWQARAFGVQGRA